MGIIKCKLHGQTGMTLISPDIEELFLADQKYKEKISEIKMMMFNHVINFSWLSSSFVERFNIPTDKESLSIDDIPDEQVEELLNSLVGVCGKCFIDWINRYNTEIEQTNR